MTQNGQHRPVAVRLRRLVPAPFRRAGAYMVAAHRASRVERDLESLAHDRRPILLGPWLGEVGFELLYWIPFLRWFVERYEVRRDRLIAVSRGGAAAWYTPFAGRSHDALAFMSQDEFRRKNEDRTGSLGEQKQVRDRPRSRRRSSASSAGAEGRRRRGAASVDDVSPVCAVLVGTSADGLGPAVHALRAAARRRRSTSSCRAGYTAVKFYFNDCFSRHAAQPGVRRAHDPCAGLTRDR